MKQEIETILQSTPFNSYEDLFIAVYNKKATIKLSNSACRQIAQTEKPIFSNLGMYFGFIASAIMTVALSVYSTNYLLLLLLFAEFVFPLAVYLLNNLKIKTGFIAGIIVVCDLFFFKMPLPILILSWCWLFCSWSVIWWQKRVYTMSVKILKYNEDAFVWAFTSHNLLIEDCYGNVYSMLQYVQKMGEYEKLLKVLKIGAGVQNVDDAIMVFSSFYLKKGFYIPAELYCDLDNMPETKKHESLLKILELGTQVTGVDNVTKKLIEFYKAHGITFPND